MPALRRLVLSLLSVAVISPVTTAVGRPHPGRRPATLWWQATFDVRFPIRSDWSFWGQGQQESYGQPAIVTAASARLRGPSHSRVLKLAHRAGDPARNHKLYKSWSRSSWPRGHDRGPSLSSPIDVSGRYSCRLYIPSAGLHLGRTGYINLEQLKEDYVDAEGSFQSTPDYWVGMNAFAGPPVLDLNSNDPHRRPVEVDARPFLNRWFTIGMRLYQHRRLELRLDGRLVDTALHREFPVGRRYYIGQHDERGSRILANRGWTFGVGNYVGTQQQSSTVFADSCSLRPLP